jgi:hypothetical protein
MWWFFLALLVLPSALSSQVLLNEVYYDHPGRDGGYEFVELINGDPVPRPLRGYSLEAFDAASGRWTPVWQSSIIDTITASGLFVVGDEYVFPAPNTVLRLNLQNGPDALRLSKDGTPVDRLGYGELSNTDAFETESAEDVEAGFSLGRVPDGADTDNNGTDFQQVPASPGRFNVPRNDIRLEPAGNTPVKRAVEDGVGEVLQLTIWNGGIHPVAGVDVRVALTDSTESYVYSMEPVVLGGVMQPGEGRDVSFSVSLDTGYHWFIVRARYALDERPANDVVVFLRRAGDVRLLISEVMSYPTAGCPEYVELHNAGPRLYDLSGHSLRDAAHSPQRVLDEASVLTADGFVVLTADRAQLLACFPDVLPAAVVEVEPPWPSLNHTGGGVADSVVVLDRYGLTVATAGYPPQPGDSRGVSLERVDLYAGSPHPTWVLSSGIMGGTPGRRSPSALREPPAKRVSLSSHTFAPADGERLFIALSGAYTCERAVVRIYDINGYKIREVGSTSQLPMVFVWDGLDDHGGAVTPAIYIMACEFIESTGGRTVTKRVVGCGRSQK